MTIALIVVAAVVADFVLACVIGRLLNLLGHARRERDTALAAVAVERRRLARSVGHPSVRPLVPDTVEEVRQVGRW